jgi:hypothetical protein
MMYEIVHIQEKYALDIISAIFQRNLNTPKVKFFTTLFCPCDKTHAVACEQVECQSSCRGPELSAYGPVCVCVCQQMEAGGWGGGWRSQEANIRGEEKNRARRL